MMENKNRENLGKAADSEVNESALDSYANVEPEHSIWKQIVVLHTRGAWKNFIIVLTVTAHIQLILYDISFRGRTAFSPVYSSSLADGKFAMNCIYAFDVVSAIVYKRWTRLSSTYGQPTRPMASLIVDVISLIPFEWIHRLITKDRNLNVSYLMSVNYLLRIHRLFSFFNSTRYSVGRRRIYVKVIEFLVLIFSMTGVAVAAMIRTVDMINLDLNWLMIIKERSSYPNTEFEWCIISYYVMIAQISGHGLPEVYRGIYSVPFILIVLVSLCVLQAFEIAHLTDVILQRDYNRSLFNREVQLLEKYLNDMDAAKETREKVKKYYNFFWKTQGTSHFKIMNFNMFPTIFLKECALELSWDTYKHSHLFRDQPIPFLRNLALRFEREYYRPGEVIIEKYEPKNKMIYVVTGVVQFLSEEDDQSPILSFSGGTLLGESTLILSHRSLCNVVARTEVVLNVLHQDKFVELMVYRYQDIYRVIQSRIRFRYWKALRMASIGTALQKHKSHIETVPACTDVAWLKQTLRVLQNRFNRTISKKERKDMHADTIFATTDIRYTFANLDMLVISDDTAVVTEQVCLNNGQIPWIFYPESTILKSWEGFVLVCCLALTLIIPIYEISPKHRNVTFHLVLNILCSVYLIDLIIISSTAIHEGDRVQTSIIEIISRRMHDVSYWADIVSAFPVDWILIMFGSQNAAILAYCKMNRLVKIHKFEGFFSSLEDRMILSSYKIRAIKYSFYMTILTYLSGACILLVTCPNGQCDPSGWLLTFINDSNDDLKGMHVTVAFIYAAQILVGIGTDIIAPKIITEYLVSIPLLVLGAGVSNFVISSILASQILGTYTRSWLRFDTMNIALMLNLSKVSKSIQRRVFNYLEMEWLDNSAYVLTFERSLFESLTPKLKKELNAERLLPLIRAVDLFQDMEEECLKELSSVCKLILFPPQEVVGYRGNECRAMYIVEKGHCQVWRNFDVEPVNVGRGEALYVIEMFYNLKNTRTVTTVTHVSIVEIKLKDLMRVLSQFSMEKTILTKILKKFKKSREFSKLINIQAILPKQNMTKEFDNKSPNKNHFRTQMNPKNRGRDKRTAKNEPEERSWKETTLTLLLLKSTINPDGRFLKIWEGLRCTCAYLLVTFYSANAVFSQIIPDMFEVVSVTFLSIGKPRLRNIISLCLQIVISALNCTMVIDLYVRLHVQFYNEEKILVTHPLSTAKNYVRTSLVIDVIAVFPLEYFFISESDHNMKKLWLCRLNRLLMSHRIIGAVRHYYSWPYMSKYINCLMFLPIVVLTGHVFACGLLLELCEVGTDVEKSESFGSGINCSPKNVVIRYKPVEPITPLKMYLYTVLYVFGTLTKIGSVTLKPITYTAILYILVMTFVSFLILMVVTTYIISTISRRDVTLTAYQKQMTILISFLNENKVSTEVRDQLLRKILAPEEGNVDIKTDAVVPTRTSGRRSLVRLWTDSYEGFESSFTTTIVTDRMEVKFYSNGSEVLRVNFVHRKVAFIHWGWVEAFGPDGSQLAILGPGSIVGNFTSSGSMRQTCSLISRSHVEAIVIESADFFDLMMRHPQTKKSFLAAAALSTDFLRAESEPEEVEVVSEARNNRASFILLPNTTWIQAWELFSVLFGCYLPFVIFAYRMTVQRFNALWVIFFYVVDIVFIVKLVLVFFTAFEDNRGDYVRDKSRIAERFRKSTLGLYFHLFTIAPFEVLTIFVTNPESKWNTLAWLRSNRVPRLILVVNYFRRGCNRLNINVSRMRLCYSAILVFSLLHGAASLMRITENMVTEEESEELEGFEAYVARFYTVTAMLTVVSSRDFPKDIPEAMCFVVLFLLFYFAHAVLLGEVCAIVDVKQFIMNQYERSITFFHQRVDKMDLTHALRSNAWRYGSELWKIRSGQQTPLLIREAPAYIQCAVSFEIYAHHLFENEIFGSLHEDLIKQLTFHFKVSLFLPGDRIVNVKDIDETIYFIDKGIVEVSSSELANPSGEDELGPGEYFGLLQGLYETMPHTATYTAKTTAHIILLYRPHWIHLLKYFPVSTVSLYTFATRIIRASGLEAYV